MHEINSKTTLNLSQHQYMFLPREWLCSGQLLTLHWGGGNGIKDFLNTDDIFLERLSPKLL